MLKKVFFILFVFIQLKAFAQDSKTYWVDSVFQTLNTSEKISQLFWVQLPANLNENDFLKLKPGGILITQSGPVSHANRVNKLQQNSEVPLLVISDSWTVDQHIDSIIPMQAPGLWGALQPDLIRKAGAETFRQQQLLGIHGNLLSVSLYKNEVHSYKNSRVQDAYLNYFKGLTASQNIALLNGSSEADSLWTKQLLQVTSGAVSSHSGIIDFETNERDKLNEDELLPRPDYNGLLIGEIPYLKNLAGKQPVGEVELIALYLGHDVILGSVDMPAAIKKISRAARKNKELQARIDDAIRKILRLKYEAGLDSAKLINTDNLLARLNNPESKLLHHQISENTVTLLNNQNQFLPIVQLENRKFASISIGQSEKNEFTRYLSKYAPFKHFELLNIKDTTTLKSELADVDVLVVGLFTYREDLIPFLKNLSRHKKVIVSHLSRFVDGLIHFKDFPVLLTGYSSALEIQKFQLR